MMDGRTDGLEKQRKNDVINKQRNKETDRQINNQLD